jgi:hypothetical protein
MDEAIPKGETEVVRMSQAQNCFSAAISIIFIWTFQIN